MRNEFNIYCDESCHLENDRQKAMVIGAVWSPKNKVHEIFREMRNIRIKHAISSSLEIKWNKVSPAKLEFYSDLIEYFFANRNLHFRALVIPDKSILNHADFGQTHDDFYYKMYFDLLKIILDPNSSYNIYLDIKDTQSERKVLHLEEVLRHSHYDFSNEILKKIQQVRSHEVELIQMADLLIGALSYLYRGLSSSESKIKLIELIRKLSGYSLNKSTLYKESKFNLFIWHPQKKGINGN